MVVSGFLVVKQKNCNLITHCIHSLINKDYNYTQKDFGIIQQILNYSHWDFNYCVCNTVNLLICKSCIALNKRLLLKLSTK